jgi:hypothetical protein
MSDGSESPAAHASEPHIGGLGQKLNWLRAGVLERTTASYRLPVWSSAWQRRRRIRARY